MSKAFRPAYYPGEPKHRARKLKKNKGAFYGFSAAQRHAIKAALKERDGDACGICGQPLDYDETLDHIVEQAAGGTDDLANLRVTHARCNSARNSREAGIKGSEWQRQIPRADRKG